MYLSGLGTMGLEMYEQVPKLDAVILPAGGHCGLLAGSAAALKHLNPRISVIVSLLSPSKSCILITFATDFYFQKHWNIVICWHGPPVLGMGTTCGHGLSLQDGPESLAATCLLAGFKIFKKVLPKHMESSSVFWIDFLLEKLDP